MLLTIDQSGNPSGVAFVHVSPPSVERWMSPSSEPAQNTPGVNGDSANLEMVHRSKVAMSVSGS